ncbi:MAG: phosphate uptake regulator PhoU [Sulfolobales archaeon]|nr:phosphate uptake regulator PhoU [Sulfolobales archaeon]MCX8185809.1 phosphate uptake regulator PhoU [Sulfolobales archaeon]MDW7969306.1 phosphate uptake regulator PhoU [Sulfolobales archaeon]
MVNDLIKSEVRTLQKVGGSLALYLPKEWCEINNVSKGSKINLRYSDDFICLDVDRPEKVKGLSIDTTSLLEGELKYIIISLYILGFDYVKFTSNRRISLPLRRYLVSSLKHTPEYKVVDEGDNFITIKRVGEGEDLIKALIREFNIVSTVLRYALEAIESGKDFWDYSDAVEELDSEVDRARTEVERAAYKLTEKPYLNPLKMRYVIPSVLISKLLERLADHIVLLISELEKPPNELRRSLLELLNELNSNYEGLRKVFEDHFPSKQIISIEDVGPTISKLVYIVEGKKKFREVVIKTLQGISSELVMYHVIRIYDYLTDTAEVLINVLVDSTSHA